MATLTFQQISFQEQLTAVKITFLKLYEFEIPQTKLDNIGKWNITSNTITFNSISHRQASKKFQFLLEEGFKHLTNKLTKRQTFYIHKNSGIPLFGCIYFGIIDKGSSMIEVKPMTGCNMNCIFCSVDEGIDSKRQNDYLVEREYLVEETKKLLDFKNKPIDIYINPHGDPLLYPEIAELCEDLCKLPYTNSVVIITAATLLTKPLIDKIAATKKTVLNISLHAMDTQNAQKLFGTRAYNAKQVQDMLMYAANKLKIALAPVLLEGHNENEIPKIITFAKKINAPVLAQKFLVNKHGRNPIKEESWESFFAKLKDVQQKTDYCLTGSLQKIDKTKTYPSPFKLKKKIDVTIMLPGRFPSERLAVGYGRVISIINCTKEIGTTTQVHLSKIKSGIFKANMLS